ncbi:phytoene synthase [Pedobacter sp. Leaf216]|uniref:phytoene/squalene synthase family protein n=1 Tax=Pedobacter sp. Leaf216 TaxID=1735684 RepID=UPI0006F2A738|nr:phytoene/squalene synthase family protein [Pedobacter sp. Leaf216]KQM69414.1 phytoene synthase [Pedobacter sp. Leaf216]
MKETFDKVSAQCSRNVTRTYSTSFSLGINFLNKEIRGPIYAIYGFVRLADEIVDSFHGYDKASLLFRFKRDCLEAVRDSISLNPVLNSFQEVVNKYGIDLKLIHLFLNSMEMDLNREVYTQEKYERYILGSAQVVGLMCLYVFSDGNMERYERMKEPAMKLGSAFQKINFLRDVNADFYLLGRTYFPGVDLSDFSDEKKRAIEEDIAGEFDAALEGIRQLPVSSRGGVYLAYIYYRKLFDKIRKKTAAQLMAGRIRISNAYKFRLMFSSVLRQRTGRI